MSFAYVQKANQGLILPPVLCNCSSWPHFLRPPPPCCVRYRSRKLRELVACFIGSLSLPPRDVTLCSRGEGGNSSSCNGFRREWEETVELINKEMGLRQQQLEGLWFESLPRGRILQCKFYDKQWLLSSQIFHDFVHYAFIHFGNHSYGVYCNNFVSHFESLWNVATCFGIIILMWVPAVKQIY
jgi:hypothetical protein